MQLTGFNCTKF